MACGGCKKGPSLFRKKNNENKNNRIIDNSIVTKAEPSQSAFNIHVDPKQNMSKSLVHNLINAAKSQSNKIKWFRDGVSGIIKCMEGQTLYSDKDIQINRDVCSGCEFATDKSENGKLRMTSQCMAPDPENNNAPCGCFLICKTQTGSCPQKKWTHLTIGKT